MIFQATVLLDSDLTLLCLELLQLRLGAHTLVAAAFTAVSVIAP
jgi:hypothetical protein